jgi:hypothetical protein
MQHAKHDLYELSAGERARVPADAHLARTHKTFMEWEAWCAALPRRMDLSAGAKNDFLVIGLFDMPLASASF